MAVLKNIATLSDKDAKTREAQFEAEMLAMIAQDPSRPPGSTAPSVKISSAQSRSASVPLAVVSSPAPIRDGIQIFVTANGQTAHYNNLEAVPGPLRQHIMSAWIGSPVSAVPPMLNAPAPRNDTLPSPAKTR